MSMWIQVEFFCFLRIIPIRAWFWKLFLRWQVLISIIWIILLANQAIHGSVKKEKNIGKSIIVLDVSPKVLSCFSLQVAQVRMSSFDNHNYMASASSSMCYTWAPYVFPLMRWLIVLCLHNCLSWMSDYTKEVLPDFPSCFYLRL